MPKIPTSVADIQSMVEALLSEKAGQTLSRLRVCATADPPR